METIIITLDAEKLAKGIVSDIKKRVKSIESHHKLNQSHVKAI